MDGLFDSSGKVADLVLSCRVVSAAESVATAKSEDGASKLVIVTLISE